MHTSHLRHALPAAPGTLCKGAGQVVEKVLEAVEAVASHPCPLAGKGAGAEDSARAAARR